MVKRKIIGFFTVILLVVIALYIGRYAILGAMGNFLIKTDEVAPVEVLFVLSGQALDRGTAAAKLLESGAVAQVICTGANQAPDLQVFGSELLESDLTKKQIDMLTDSTYAVMVMHEGKSTFEEAENIVAYCFAEDIAHFGVLSSMFHTRRVYGVFKRSVRQTDLSFSVYGAASSAYNEATWWENEYGLLAVNNEYVKLFYYWLKY